ncbi:MULTISPECIES: B-4DMT family transporter [unclassified Rhodococcus (in: high G+C Gram-positive bacteria)]|uniref:B-4DMT family transporter n=1 Tax=unclassified Rhodococcus (in: high G+C Gram-positive bacteria) TaxID=192944 RepID=UPI0006F86153|nr:MULTISPECIES: B-4DMT family transporter [unclassified Rhodococcus (in: high G+C Gram-positive bacteria)]KQU34632.1 hypothetical protein ASG69_01295 [Rhodococcus sp. Leaf225]KQU45394.1 hypothetical protein ASH03_08845 [Rhodococcus sp. Leaf258]
MTGWVVRGVGMALVHVVARVLLALAVSAWPAQGSVLRMITLAAVVLVAVVWGGIDGINAHRRGDHGEGRTDFTMLWLKASVVAGVLAGLVCWVFSAVANLAVSSNSLFFEVTSGAAFTILLVFIPTVIAVTVGRWLAGRGDDKQEDLRPGKKEDATERDRVTFGAPARGESDADTEVFAPVRDSDRRPNLAKGDRSS